MMGKPGAQSSGVPEKGEAPTMSGDGEPSALGGSVWETSAPPGAGASRPARGGEEAGGGAFVGLPAGGG